MDEKVRQRVEASFAKQPFMGLLGARITELESGVALLRMPVRADLAQQHGFVHAGAVSAVLDTACGYAALTVMDDGVGVLTAEYKVNLLRPASGQALMARAEVVQSGRTLVVCQAKAWMVDGADVEASSPVAVMTATLVSVRGRPDVVD